MSEEAKHPLWTETDGVERRKRLELLRREEYDRLYYGLARCTACGGTAKIVRFGLGGNGIWIGCDRSPECCGHIEYHSEGWSLEEVASEWNRKNSGLLGLARRAKDFFRRRWGKLARMNRAYAAKLEMEKEERRQHLREIMAIGEHENQRYLSRLVSRILNRQAKNRKRRAKKET